MMPHVQLQTPDGKYPVPALFRPGYPCGSHAFLCCLTPSILLERIATLLIEQREFAASVMPHARLDLNGTVLQARS
jgi:hypothetical protein